MFRFFNVAQRVAGSKCPLSAKSTSVGHVVPADVAHYHRESWSSCVDDAQVYKNSEEDQAERCHSWRWGVDFSPRHVMVTKVRRERSRGCRWRGRWEERHGEEGCRRDWNETWKACHHDMWSSCHRTWHFIEAVGWGTAAVIGYQITHPDRRKEERCARRLEEHRCIVQRVCTALSSCLSSFGQIPHNSSTLLKRYMLPQVPVTDQHIIPTTTEGENNSVLPEASLAVSSKAEFISKESAYSWEDFIEQTANFKFDKFTFTPRSSLSDPELSSTPVTCTSPVDGSAPAPSLDTLMCEIVSDWQVIARDYCSLLDNSVAVSKARRGHASEAVKSWLKIVEETDNSKALFNLALSYEQGLGTDRNMEKAMEYYRRSAGKGHPQAAYNLAMHILKENNDKRLEEVKQLLTLAASHGLAQAQRELAYIYAEENPTDLTEAVALFQKAAEKKDMHSCYNLGVCYEQGLVVEIDESKAVEMFEKAALLGHPDALYSLASYHETGRAGLSVDKEKALLLYESAERGGNGDSKACVERLRAELSTVSKLSNKLPNTLCVESDSVIKRNPSSVVTFSRLLSTGSDASSSSSLISSCEDDDWGTYDSSEVKVREVGSKFFVGFSSEEED